MPEDGNSGFSWGLLVSSLLFLFFPATVREGTALSKQTSVFQWICLSGPLMRWGKRIRLEDAPKGTHHPGLPGTTLGFSSECPSTPESFHPVLTGTVCHWPPVEFPSQPWSPGGETPKAVTPSGDVHERRVSSSPHRELFIFWQQRKNWAWASTLLPQLQDRE